MTNQLDIATNLFSKCHLKVINSWHKIWWPFYKEEIHASFWNTKKKWASCLKIQGFLCVDVFADTQKIFWLYVNVEVQIIFQFFYSVFCIIHSLNLFTH